MTPLWQAPAILVVLVSWLTATPVTFADLARREALRRQWTAASVGSFNGDDLAPVPPGAVAPPAAATVEAAGPPADPPAAAAEEKRGEAWWRSRMASARASLDRNQVLVEAMQTRVNALQTDVVNRDDPAQREVLRQQLQRALDELDRLKKQVAADEQAIKEIQTDARRQGVPPGWVR